MTNNKNKIESLLKQVVGMREVIRTLLKTQQLKLNLKPFKIQIKTHLNVFSVHKKCSIIIKTNYKIEV